MVYKHFQPEKTFFCTSESTTEGHPDKICDQISDAVLDEIYKKDPKARVDCETIVKSDWILLTGEITTKAKINYENVVKKILKEMGYDKEEKGINYKTCKVKTEIKEQSPDISRGVSKGGAGDQGIMAGYACKETKELMPLPIILAHKLTKKAAELRKNKKLKFLRPDGKSQVTVQYKGDKPIRVDNVVMAVQHEPWINHKKLKKEVIEKIIKTTIPKHLIDNKTKFYVNETGKFVTGGPEADSGMTGRKNIVDAYGVYGSHGGGCLSGKDPTKVDRSGAYMARHIAKNIVAANLAEKCEVILAYAIGVNNPTSFSINCFKTNKIKEEKIMKAVKKTFKLTPEGIIEQLQLRKPVYRKAAAYGHFGRKEFSWEKTDKVKKLRKEAGLTK